MQTVIMSKFNLVNLVLITGFSLSPVIGSAAVTLEIPDLTLRNTSVIRFTARPDPTPLDPEQLRTAVTVDTNRRLYRVRIPTKEIPWSAPCFCFGYTFVVEDIRTARQQVFDVRATPAGPFDEQFAEIPFSIVDGAVTEKGVVALPVASFRGESSSLVFEGTPVRRLMLSGEQTVDVQVRNTSDRFTLTATFEHAGVDFAGAFFSKVSVLESKEVPIQPGETAVIHLNVTPRSFAAIQASIPPIGPSGSHTDATLKFDYRVGPFSGDRVTRFAQPLKIRFEPTFISLLISLCAGALLGTAVRRSIRQTGALVSFLHALVAAAIAGITLEIVAMLLASGETKLVLLGHDIDPFALLPTVVIGIFSGLNGYNSARWLMQLFKPEREIPPQPVGV